MISWTIPTTESPNPGSSYSETASSSYSSFRSVTSYGSATNTALSYSVSNSYQEYRWVTENEGRSAWTSGENSFYHETSSQSGGITNGITVSDPATGSTIIMDTTTASNSDELLVSNIRNSFYYSQFGTTGGIGGTTTITSSSTNSYISTLTRYLITTTSSSYASYFNTTSADSYEDTIYSYAPSSYDITTSTFTTIVLASSSISASTVNTTTTGTESYWGGGAATVYLADTSETGYLLTASAGITGMILNLMQSFSQTTVTPLQFLSIIQIPYTIPIYDGSDSASITLTIASSESSYILPSYTSSSRSEAIAIIGSKIPLSTESVEIDVNFNTDSTFISTKNSVTQTVFGYFTTPAQGLSVTTARDIQYTQENGVLVESAFCAKTIYSTFTNSKINAIDRFTTGSLFTSTSSSFSTSANTVSPNAYTSGITYLTESSSNGAAVATQTSIYSIGFSATSGSHKHFFKINNYGFQFAPLQSESGITYTNINAGHSFPFGDWSTYGKSDFKAGVIYPQIKVYDLGTATISESFSGKSVTITSGTTNLSGTSTITVTASFADVVNGAGNATGNSSIIGNFSIFGGNNFRTQAVMTWWKDLGIYSAYSDGATMTISSPGTTDSIGSGHVLALERLTLLSIDSWGGNIIIAATSDSNAPYITGA